MAFVQKWYDSPPICCLNSRKVVSISGISCSMPLWPLWTPFPDPYWQGCFPCCHIPRRQSAASGSALPPEKVHTIITHFLFFSIHDGLRFPEVPCRSWNRDMSLMLSPFLRGAPFCARAFLAVLAHMPLRNVLLSLSDGYGTCSGCFVSQVP